MVKASNMYFVVGKQALLWEMAIRLLGSGVSLCIDFSAM